MGCEVCICVHMYSCACCDYLFRGTICKHIHLVARTTSAEPMKVTPPTFPVEDKEVILQALRQPPSSTPSHHCLLVKLDDLQTLNRGCTNAEALSATEKHITAAVSVLKALTSEAGVGVLPKAPSEPSNKKMAIQRFKSTKKRKSAKVRNIKPSVYNMPIFPYETLCLFTCEGVVSKAFSRGEGWGYSQPNFRQYTCTYNHRRNHK